LGFERHYQCKESGEVGGKMRAKPVGRWDDQLLPKEKCDRRWQQRRGSQVRISIVKRSEFAARVLGDHFNGKYESMKREVHLKRN